MKRYLFFLFFSICISTSLFAQIKSTKLVDIEKQVLRVAVSDTSNQDVFSKNLGLNRISVSYKNNQPYYLFLSFENKNKDYDKYEHYDLAFEGDAYVFEQKYGPIYFKDPKVNIQSIWEVKDTTTEFILKNTSIFKDTISYFFSQIWPGMDIKSNDMENIVGEPARYIGDLKELEASLTKTFAKTKNQTVTDSVVVFRGIIGKLYENNIRQMELIVGQPSAFSDLVQKEFEKKASLWRPAGIDRGAIETTVRIYARLNPDGSVTIKTPGKLRSFTGD